MSRAPAPDPRPRWQKPAFYAGLFVVAVLLGVWVLGLTGNLATTPITYSEDGIAASVGVKGIIDNGQPYTNRYLSAPDGAEYFDFPNADAALIAGIWLLSRFTHNYVLVLNLFALLTYPLIALAAAWSMRRLGVSAPVAAVLALLYALLPFHQSRVTFHLFLSAYFIVPLVVVLIAEVVLRPDEAPTKRRVLGLPFWGWGVVLLMGTCGMYYAFFGLVLVVVAGVLVAYRQRTWRAAMPALAIVLGVVVLLGLQMAPSYAYWQSEGRNSTGDLRQPVESDFFGLRLTQLVYPMTDHRVSALAGAKQFLRDSLVTISPNMAYIAYDSSLGLVGVVGLFILGFWMLAAPFRAPPGGTDGTPGKLAFLGISSFLLGTVGGVGSLVAFIAFPQIRAYDRITVYIGFVSLCAVAWAADALLARFARAPRRGARVAVTALACAAVLVIGVLDQTNPSVVGPDYEAIRAEFESDATFVAQIEDVLDDDALVFQLPFIAYAEGATQGDIGTYQPMRLYLHSSSIRWSAGAFTGRPTAAWQAKTADLDAREMLDALAEAGFSGVSVDRDGYEDDGAEVEAALSSALDGQEPVESPDGRYACFVLRR